MTLITSGLVNAELILLPSAARIATVSSDDQENAGCNKGAILVINVSGMTAAPILTPKLQLKDPISGNYKDIWTAATNLTAVYLFPRVFAYIFGLAGAGSAGDYTEGVNILLPRTFRFQMIHANADEAIYSAAIVLLI